MTLPSDRSPVVEDLAQHRDRFRKRVTDNSGGDSGSGGGGSMDDVVRRVAALEKGLEKLDGKIDKLTELVNAFGLKTSERLGGIEGRLTGIEKTLESKASSADVKLVEGKVSSIPTTWQVVGLMGALVVGTLGGVAGLAFALARYLKP